MSHDLSWDQTSSPFSIRTQIINVELKMTVLDFRGHYMMLNHRVPTNFQRTKECGGCVVKSF